MARGECSGRLGAGARGGPPRPLCISEELATKTLRRRLGRRFLAEGIRRARGQPDAAGHFFGGNGARSEERRVGEEGGTRGGPDHLKKKNENRTRYQS